MGTPARTDLPLHQRVPELEHESSRLPDLGYEGPEEAGFIRCLAHGIPTPLARWHCHDEYELHLITATSGRAFVGNWIGHFEPGHLVLTGPRLPHNWISTDAPTCGVPERDLVIQFLHGPLDAASQQIPELSEALPMLARAQHGIEFFGLSEPARSAYWRIRSLRGLQRFAAFCEWLAQLARWTDYRLLSTVQIQGGDDEALDRVDAIVARITGNLAQVPSLDRLAEELGMTESRFSRFFRRATGNTYTDFVNQVRINRACQLLMASDSYITNICWDVGFNNISNFNRRFLEIKGMTPSEFRRRAAGRFDASTS